MPGLTCGLLDQVPEDEIDREEPKHRAAEEENAQIERVSIVYEAHPASGKHAEEAEANCLVGGVGQEAAFVRQGLAIDALHLESRVEMEVTDSQGGIFQHLACSN